MSSRVIRGSICLQEQSWRKLDEIAARRGVARSEIVRQAVDQFFAFDAGKSWSPRRVAELMEFTQLVADHWLKTNHPELKERVVDATLRRMEKYHGG